MARAGPRLVLQDRLNLFRPLPRTSINYMYVPPKHQTLATDQTTTQPYFNKRPPNKKQIILVLVLWQRPWPQEKINKVNSVSLFILRWKSTDLVTEQTRITFQQFWLWLWVTSVRLQCFIVPRLLSHVIWQIKPIALPPLTKKNTYLPLLSSWSLSQSCSLSMSCSSVAVGVCTLSQS